MMTELQYLRQPEQERGNQKRQPSTPRPQNEKDAANEADNRIRMTIKCRQQARDYARADQRAVLVPFFPGFVRAPIFPHDGEQRQNNERKRKAIEIGAFRNQSARD